MLAKSAQQYFDPDGDLWTELPPALGLWQTAAIDKMLIDPCRLPRVRTAVSAGHLTDLPYDGDEVGHLLGPALASGVLVLPFGVEGRRVRALCARWTELCAC